MAKVLISALTLVSLALAACADASRFEWYENRCAERYELQRGTDEFNACVERERRIVEDTQRRADRSLGSP